MSFEFECNTCNILNAHAILFFQGIKSVNEKQIPTLEIDQGNKICIRRIKIVYMHMYILKTTFTQTNCHLNFEKLLGIIFHKVQR